MGKTSGNTEKTDVSTSRRGFIKKAAYTAPTLLILGSLTKTQDVKAADFGLPPSLFQPPGSPALPTRQRQRR